MEAVFTSNFCKASAARSTCNSAAFGLMASAAFKALVASPSLYFSANRPATSRCAGQKFASSSSAAGNVSLTSTLNWPLLRVHRAYSAAARPTQSHPRRFNRSFVLSKVDEPRVRRLRFFHFAARGVQFGDEPARGELRVVVLKCLARSLFGPLQFAAVKQE